MIFHTLLHVYCRVQKENVCKTGLLIYLLLQEIVSLLLNRRSYCFRNNNDRRLGFKAKCQLIAAIKFHFTLMLRFRYEPIERSIPSEIKDSIASFAIIR